MAALLKFTLCASLLVLYAHAGDMGGFGGAPGVGGGSYSGGGGIGGGSYSGGGIGGGSYSSGGGGSSYLPPSLPDAPIGGGSKCGGSQQP